MLKKLWVKYQGLFYQFSRFVGIGFLNTGVDFSVINLLIAFTGITAGWRLSILNSVSFVIAILHSFLWNKFWAFGQSDEGPAKSFARVSAAGLVGALAVLAALYGAGKQLSGGYFLITIFVLFVLEVVLWYSFKIKTARGSAAAEQFSLFVLVSIVGTIINSSIVGLITGFIPPMFGLNPKIWANMAKILSTGIALIWNFIGYKVFVFKK